MDPTPIYSGYSIFFGVIDNFDPPKKPLPLPPPEATRLEEMVDHPAAIVQVERKRTNGRRGEVMKKMGD